MLMSYRSAMVNPKSDAISDKIKFKLMNKNVKHAEKKFKDWHIEHRVISEVAI